MLFARTSVMTSQKTVTDSKLREAYLNAKPGLSQEHMWVSKKISFPTMT